MGTLLRLTTALAVFALSGCATVQTGSFVDHGVDFSQYRTYNWAPQAPPTGDPRLERDAAFQDHLQGEVEKEFAAKGLTGPTSRRPQLLVRYRAATTPRVTVNGPESGYGYCSIDCTSRIVEYETATLIVDVLDARTRKLIWRGWAQDRLDEVLGNSDRMKKRLHEAVTHMLANFPSRA
jgi:hypothetical protein